MQQNDGPVDRIGDTRIPEGLRECIGEREVSNAVVPIR